jgi:RHS repeat-associated protein
MVRMSRWLCMRSLCVATIFALLPVLAQGQILNIGDDTSTPIPGAGHDYIKMLSETVNPANGSLSIRIQTPTPPGRGITLPFSFAYDSNGAQHLASAGNGETYWNDNNAYLSQGGWSYSIPMLSNTRGSRPLPPPHTCFFFMDYMFQDPTGGRHSLGLSYVPGYPTGPCSQASPAPGQVVSGGDDYYRASMGATGGEPVLVADAAGTVYAFPTGASTHFSSSGGYSSLPSTIEDRNGNQIIVTDLDESGSRTPGAFNVTDPLGRTLLSSSGFGATTTSVTNTVSVAGLSAPYTITWGTASVNYRPNSWLMFNAENGCNSGIAPDTDITINVITSIELPNNQSYQFSYDPTTGKVSRITYPTGGYVAYSWSSNPRSQASTVSDDKGENNACIYQYDSAAITQRQVSFDGTHIALTQVFNYSPNNTAGTVWSNSVPQDWNTKSVQVTTTDNVSGAVYITNYTYTPIPAPVQPNDYQVFAAQLPVESIVTYENAAGTALRTVTKNWFDQFELKSQQTQLNDGPTLPTDLVTYTYGPGAQVTEKDEYDYGSGNPPSTPLRKTITNYQSFAATPIFPGYASIFNRACQVVTKDGSNNWQAETDYYYDNGATGTPCAPAGTPSFTLVSNLTEHDETNYGSGSTASRGNVTQKNQFSTTIASSVTTYTYDETGQVLTMKDPCGNASCADMTGSNHTTQYAYNNNYTELSGGQNVTYTPSGNTNAYLYSITNPLGQVEYFTYDFNNGQLTALKDENSQVSTFVYNDVFARPTLFSYPDGGQKEYVYKDTAPSPTVTTCELINGTANATCSATSPANGWKTDLATMDGMGHVVQTELVSDPDGATYTASVYDGLNRTYKAYNPTRCSSPTGNCGTETTWGFTTTTYDAVNRVISVVQQDGSTAATSYSGNQTTVTDEAGNQRSSQTDGLGRLTNVWEAPNTSGYNFQTQYQYDTLDDLICAVQQGTSTTQFTTCAAASSTWRPRSFAYDAMKRLTSATNPESGTITYSYDANSNLSSRVSPKANQTGTAQTAANYTYDVLNRMTVRSYTDPNSGTDKYAYDGTALTGCPGPAAPTISEAVNLIGRRSAMCSGQESSAWSFDPMGRPQIDDRVNRGSSTLGYDVKYSYTFDGSVSTLTYPSGDVLTYTPGGAGRMLGVSDSSNTFVASSSTNRATYDPSGGLATMINGVTSGFTGIVTANTYNQRLQPILMSASTDKLSTTVSSASYPSCPSGGCSATFSVASSTGINVNDTVTVEGNSNDALNGTFAVTAVASGQVTVPLSSSTAGSGTGGTLIDDTTGLLFSLCYDLHSQVAISSGPCKISAYTAPNGNNGNVYQVLNNVDSTRSAIYQYDPLNRLAQANTINTTSANCWGELYSTAGYTGLDPWGNLTNRAAPSNISGTCMTEPLTVGPPSVLNQLSTPRTYDAAGNMTNDGNGNSPTYDQENRIATDQNYTYYYDGDGNRMEKADGSTGTMYWYGPSGEVLAETSLTGTINEEYVFFNGQRIARIDRPNGAVHYYFSDHLQSASVITDSSGNITAEDFYYPYGGLIASTGSDPNHYKFTGKERDSESNLDNFGARYFTSNIGRFMTPDWAARPTAVPYAAFGDPQSLNLYTYVRNDPVSRADADGHQEATIAPASGQWGDGDFDDFTDSRDVADQAGNTTNTSNKPGAQNTANQPAPTNPDGSPKPPTNDVPKLPDGKPPGWKPGDPLVPNEWEQKDPGKGDREKWGPKYPIPGGSQPGVSWDPEGHWDHDDGNRNRTRWLPGGGGQVDHDNNPTMMDRMRSITPGPILKWGTVGVVGFIIIDEGSRFVFPLRNLVPVP